MLKDTDETSPRLWPTTRRQTGHGRKCGQQAPITLSLVPVSPVTVTVVGLRSSCEGRFPERQKEVWFSMKDNNRSITRSSSTAAGNQEQVLDQIRKRAYYLYEARGKQDGYDLDDWLLAEAEITQKPKTAAA